MKRVIPLLFYHKSQKVDFVFVLLKNVRKENGLGGVTSMLVFRGQGRDS